MTKQNTGYKFEKEFESRMIEEGYLCLKIPDTRYLSGMVKAAIGSTKYMAGQVPCDYLVLGNKATQYVELKRTGLASIPLKNIKMHQISTMLKIQGTGNQADFVINFYKRNKFARKATKHNVYWVTALALGSMYNYAENLGRSSIKESEIANNAYKFQNWVNM